jgi:hypothetical protein
VRSSDSLNIVLDIERRYDVAAWSIAGVRVWPLVRIRLHTDQMNRAFLADEAPSRLDRLRELAHRLISARLRVALASWRDRRANARLGDPADVVFYSDGVNFVKVDGLWYDKLFDPIIAWVRERGGRHLLLTPMARAHHPRRSASKFVQPRLDAIKLRAAAKTDVAGEVHLPQFEAAMAGRSMDRAQLFHLWNRLCALSAYFQHIVESARPSRAFVNTYYSVEGLAFVLACRRCGVPVADVQHGLQGDYHVAYGQWLNVPSGGYELLPDEFWVWGEHERQAIERWRSPAVANHAPIVAGNAWLELWRSGTEPFIANTMRQALALRRPEARSCILVTLQWGLQDEETLRLLRAIARAPADFQWWVRLHPLVAHDRRPVRAMLEQHGLRNVELDAPTDLPLHAMLRVTDVHVTHSSSTVVEATEFGVRSVICSEYGAQFFSAQIEAGRAVLAITEEQIVAAVVRLAAGRQQELAAPQRADLLGTVLSHAFPKL